ncbi:hypothetical protein PIB30_098227 [Stylosanthes scabra]|uniref:Uncharacterized protein n=1 Tax=Stylosanthes scabra TaxID=79078 RepID=A0ABU6TW30_9FABA|nr:hypothetical protein [Stylosanthes scabra]
MGLKRGVLFLPWAKRKSLIHLVHLTFQLSTVRCHIDFVQNGGVGQGNGRVSFLFPVFVQSSLLATPPMTGAGGPSRASHERQPSTEEHDQLNRSKYVRKDEEGFTGSQLLLPRDEEWMNDKLEKEEAPKGGISFARVVRGDKIEGDAEDKLEKEEEVSEEIDDTCGKKCSPKIVFIGTNA